MNEIKAAAAKSPDNGPDQNLLDDSLPLRAQDAPLLTRDPAKYFRHLYESLERVAIACTPHFVFGAGQSRSWRVDQQGRRRSCAVAEERTRKQLGEELERSFLPGCDLQPMISQLRDLKAQLVDAGAPFVTAVRDSRLDISMPHEGGVFQHMKYVPEDIDAERAQELRQVGRRIQREMRALLGAAYQEMPIRTSRIVISHIHDLSGAEREEIERLCVRYPCAENMELVPSKGLASLAPYQVAGRNVKDGVILRAFETTPWSARKLQGVLSIDTPQTLPFLARYNELQSLPGYGVDLGALRNGVVDPFAPPHVYAQLLYSSLSYLALHGANAVTGWIHSRNKKSFMVHAGRYGCEITGITQQRPDPGHAAPHTFIAVYRDLRWTMEHFAGSLAFTRDHAAAIAEGVQEAISRDAAGATHDMVRRPLPI